MIANNQPNKPSENIYRTALEDIVLQLQTKKMELEFRVKTAKGSVEYNVTRCNRLKVILDTINETYSYIKEIYENAVVNDMKKNGYNIEGHN